MLRRIILLSVGLILYVQVYFLGLPRGSFCLFLGFCMEFFAILWQFEEKALFLQRNTKVNTFIFFNQ